jgi:hypothetical protein
MRKLSTQAAARVSAARSRRCQQAGLRKDKVARWDLLNPLRSEAAFELMLSEALKPKTRVVKREGSASASS